MLDDHTFGVEQPEPRGGFARWRWLYRPAWTAAARFGVFFFLLALVTLFTGWASLPVTLALQALLSLGAGVQAGKTLRRQETPRVRYASVGAWAGALLVLGTFALVLLLAIWVGLGTFGAALPLMLPYFLSLPVMLLVCAGLGVLGARWVEKRGGASA